MEKLREKLYEQLKIDSSIKVEDKQLLSLGLKKVNSIEYKSSKNDNLYSVDNEGNVSFAECAVLELLLIEFSQKLLEEAESKLESKSWEIKILKRPVNVKNSNKLSGLQTEYKGLFKRDKFKFGFIIGGTFIIGLIYYIILNLVCDIDTGCYMSLLLCLPIPILILLYAIPQFLKNKYNSFMLGFGKRITSSEFLNHVSFSEKGTFDEKYIQEFVSKKLTEEDGFQSYFSLFFGMKDDENIELLRDMLIQNLITNDKIKQINKKGGTYQTFEFVEEKAK